MMPRLSPDWVRSFAQPAAPAPTVAPQRPVPPLPPQRPVDRRPLPPEPPPLRGRALEETGFPHSRTQSVLARPRRDLELAWLTCQMPAGMRADVIFNLRQTLEWRAQYCPPLKPPRKPVACARFGAQGEQLWPRGALTVYRLLRKELRETVRVVEETQPHLERNRLLAMRGARLGQLCVDLEQRGQDALEEVRCGLTWLWN